MEIKKIKISDYVMLPRLQHHGLKPHHVERDDFKAEFDKILSFCLIKNQWCEYIEGDLSILCVIAGFNAEELTPKYPDFIKERVLALYDAVYWWYEYGKERRWMAVGIAMAIQECGTESLDYFAMLRGWGLARPSAGSGIV